MKTHYTSYSQLNTTQKIQAFNIMISNQKWFPKSTLCYFLRMIDSQKYMFADYMKRQEVEDILTELIEKKNCINLCVCSEWTQQQVLNTYNKKVVEK